MPYILFKQNICPFFLFSLILSFFFYTCSFYFFFFLSIPLFPSLRYLLNLLFWVSTLLNPNLWKTREGSGVVQNTLETLERERKRTKQTSTTTTTTQLCSSLLLSNLAFLSSDVHFFSLSFYLFVPISTIKCCASY